MTTRYYKVVDQNIIDVLKDYYDRLKKNQKEANKLAKKYGFEKAVFRGFGMWEATLSAFKCSYMQYRSRDDKSMWTKPDRNNETRPKKIKESSIYKEFYDLSDKLKITEKEISNKIGFGYMDYFPARPGFLYDQENNLLIFKMPTKCTKLKGAIEISNIEYMELIEK